MRSLIEFVHLQCARLSLARRGLAHAGSTSALLTLAAASSSSVSASQFLVRVTGHRVTLTRPRLLRRPLVIRTNANPDHASALIDLRAMFLARTDSVYRPRRGDVLTHEAPK